MSFDSYVFYIFLFLSLLFTEYFRGRSRQWAILASSIVFYAAYGIGPLFLILGLVFVTFWSGFLIETSSTDRARKRLLILSIAAVASPLLIFKILYPDIGAIENHINSPALGIPLGISFYTFHLVSYLVDIFRKDIKAERTFSSLALYSLFFPQLAAGPITRASQFFPQIQTIEHPKQLSSSFFRIYFGLFKKFIIANNLFFLISAALAAPQELSGLGVAIAVIAARYYIFADLSAYTDIAIGSAGLFGIKLPENFRRPFSASSISDFWRRWHISLSAWMRDYVFYTLLATQFRRAGIYFMTIFTFLAIGLWHGITWNFFLYGLWHGSLISLHDFSSQWRERAWKRIGLGELSRTRNGFGVFITFFFCVCPPTIFFITKDIEGVALLASRILETKGWMSLSFLREVPSKSIVIAILGILAVELIQIVQEKVSLTAAWGEKGAQVKTAVVFFLAVVFVYLAEFEGSTGFIYFRF